MTNSNRIDPIIRVLPSVVYLMSDPDFNSVSVYSRKTTHFDAHNTLNVSDKTHDLLGYRYDNSHFIECYKDEVVEADVLFSDVDASGKVMLGVDMTDHPNIKAIFGDSIQSCILHLGEFYAYDDYQNDEAFADSPVRLLKHDKNFEQDLRMANLNVVNSFDIDHVDLLNGHPILCTVYLRFSDDAPYVMIRTQDCKEDENINHMDSFASYFKTIDNFRPIKSVYFQ